MTKRHSTRRWFLLVITFSLALAGALALLGGARATTAGITATKVGLVLDTPDPTENSFIKMGYEGLLRAESELGIEGTVYTSTDPADLQPNLELCANDGNDLCITIGFQTAYAITTTAALFTQTNFSIVDIAFDNYPDNLRGIIFASEEAGYLAGTLAGYMTQSDILGIIGGMEIPTVDSFIDGYAQGALCANPVITTIITYTNSFWDFDKGAQFAQILLDQGADVVFAPAGTDGAGAILTATQSGAWAIGVDEDQYVSLFESGVISGSEYLLTSAMKRVDNAVFHTIQDQVNGSFTSGTMLYDLTTQGVDLAPYHEADAAIPASAKAAVEAARTGLLDGSIDPYGPCPVTEYRIYLPLGSQNFSPE